MLQITKLALENVGIFDSKTIAFQPGLNVIAGPNGSGKTTILTAIISTLYGAQVPKDALINVNSDNSKVFLEFIANGMAYVMEKRFYLNLPTKNVIYDSDKKMVVSGVKACRDFIQGLISDIEFGLQTWYLKQGDITKFADLIVSSALSSSLSTLLGLGNMASIPAMVLEELDRRWPNSQVRYIQAETLRNKSAEEIKILTEKIAQFPKSIEEMEKELKILRSRKQVLHNKIELFEKLGPHSFKDLKTQQESIGSQYRDYETKRSEVTQTIDVFVKKVLEELKKYFVHFDLKVEASNLSLLTTLLSREKETAVSAWSMSERFEAQKTALLTQFRERPPIAKLQQKVLSQKKSELQYFLRFYKIALENSSVLSQTQICPLCTQPVPPEITTTYHKRIAELERQYNEITTSLTSLNTNADKRTKLRKDIEELRKNLENLETTKAKLIYSSPSEYDALIQSISSYNSIYLQLHTELASYAQKENELVQLRKQITEKLEMMAALGLADESIQITPETLDECRKEYLQLTRNEAELEKQLTEYRADYAHLQSLQENHKYLVKQHIEAQRTKDKVDFILSSVKTFIGESLTLLKTGVLADRLLPTINALLEKCEAPFRIILDKEKDNFIVQLPTGQLSISRLSYGQRVLFSLITAFTLYICNNAAGVFIADEPTAGLDERNVSILGNLFTGIHQTCLDNRVQCIIASHEYATLENIGNCIMLGGE